ncbi:MAG: hypothetical protein HYX53_01640 [Chloroflexi bacterium]|nr:hypothetical protein [Chloroflexota bacterium]
MSSPMYRKEGATAITPVAGAEVVTRDGHWLGAVREVSLDSFMVDAARSRDYWLSPTVVLRASKDEIVMDFDYEVLDDYKLHSAGTRTSQSPMLDAQGDTFATIEDKELRRERMEEGGEAVKPPRRSESWHRPGPRGEATSPARGSRGRW